MRKMEQLYSSIINSPLFPPIIAAIVATVISYFVTSIREKRKVTSEMFQRYHSPIMIEARMKTWNYFNEHKDENCPSMQELWSKAIYVDIVQVVYFWYQLYNLKNRGSIDSKLARNFFSFQFAWWKKQLETFAEQSRKKDKPLPEWLEIMDGMNWIIKSEDIIR